VNVDVVIGSSGWVADRVARRDVSLGLAGERELPPGVIADPFADDEIVGIAAPGRLRLRRGRAAVRDLDGETILVREPGSSTRSVSERYLAATGCHPAKRWELDSNEAIKRSVREGLGIGFLSRLVVEEELARGELVAFGIEGAEPMRRAIRLLRPDGRELSAAEAAFVDTFRTCMPHLSKLP
jgi:DNA-binding transcriptional LysR family regulator